ncbi:hypothetical protein GCM10027162_59250 [Streptomyces incanus]
MRAFGVLSVVLPGVNGERSARDGVRPARGGVRPARGGDRQGPDDAERSAPGAVNVTSGTYNPHGGKRVQLAWLRYSSSQRRAARLYARPARLSDPVRPVLPVACR